MTSSAGVTLDTLLGATPLPADESLRHILKLGIALRSAHQQGRIFGVLDPSCIALDDSCALIEASGAGISPYSAPEVLAGGQPDIRSDVFAFGTIAYQLLTGRLPFPDGATEAPAPLLGGELPGLDRVILRCLEQDPDQRWQNLRSLCIELRLLGVAASRLPQVVKKRHSLIPELREQIRRLEQVVDSQAIERLQQKIAHTDELASRVNHMDVRLSNQDELVERSVESINSLPRSILNRVAD